MTTSRRQPSPIAHYGQPDAQGPNGRGLCRECGEEVPPGRRRTFCCQEHVDRWLSRNNPAVMRRKVFKRDQGVCALCGLDIVALEREYHRLMQEESSDAALAYLERQGYQTRRFSWEKRHAPSHFWEADHILPVAEGGGGCDLTNMRTLCLPCHHKVSQALAVRLGFRERNQRDLVKLKRWTTGVLGGN